MEKNFLDIKQLDTNKEVAYKKTTSCSKITELRNVDRVLYKMKCNWESQVKKRFEKEEEEHFIL